MEYKEKLEKVTAMKLGEEAFLKIYFSNREICVDIFINDCSILMWDNMCLMSPYGYDKFQEFVENLEKERPLLAELR